MPQKKEIIGTIVKAYAGYYYVATKEGLIECRLRGKVRYGRVQSLVGDKVEIALVDKGKGAIEKVLSRRVQLKRPSIANVDQVVLVFSVKHPDFDSTLLDRFILLTELSGIDLLICINKSDLVAHGQAKPPLPGSVWAEVERTYKKIGYPIVFTSAKSGQGINRLGKLMEGKISVMAGPSGGGKTSLLNALEPSLKLKVGEISRKLKRGKHITRHVELLQLGKGRNILVADTPGFTVLDLLHIKFWRLIDFFPEFQKYIGKCRFGADCLHDTEPGCAIKEAVEAGEIAKTRYESYVSFLREIREKKRFRYQYRVRR